MAVLPVKREEKYTYIYRGLNNGVYKDAIANNRIELRIEVGVVPRMVHNL